MDLNDFLTPEEVRHYARFIGEDSLRHFIHPDPGQPWTWTATAVTDDQPAPNRYGQIAAIERIEPRDEVLVKHGWGPDTCSSSQELALSPEWCWDVCSYYRRLGLRWKATKRQIREALVRMKATVGRGNGWLVYAAKQLLDDTIRHEYDRVPLGMLFLKDKDTEEMLKRAAQAAASAMAARGRPDVTPEDVLGDWGFTTGPRGGPEGEGREGRAPVAPLAPPPGRLAGFWELLWSWYAEPGPAPTWRASEIMELEIWQLMLVHAFANRGIRARFAVGRCSADSFSVRPAPDPGIIVILLGKGEPSPAKAAEAAEAWGLVAANRDEELPDAAMEQGRRDR
jgi:hypothetical protein